MLQNSYFTIDFPGDFLIIGNLHFVKNVFKEVRVGLELSARQQERVLDETVAAA